MNSIDRQAEYHWSQKILHWLMAVLVLAMLFIGVGMVNTVSERHLWLLGLHKPLGIMILLLVLVRLYLRWRLGAPHLPAGLPVLQQRLARVSHGLLYGLLVAQPLCGLLMQWFGAYPVSGFSHADLPYPQVYTFLRTAHAVLAYSLFGVVLLHLTAALVHGFIYRDQVLPSMTWRR